MSERSHLSIGEVLSLLREEFPDVTISKIRFLESQGLVDPERTPSGYRKFYDHDVERLRWILRQQREHFLPLKVIRGRLTDQGEEVEDLGLAEEDDGHTERGETAGEVGEPAAPAPAALADLDPTAEISEREQAPVKAAVSASTATSEAAASPTGSPPSPPAENQPDLQPAGVAAAASRRDLAAAGRGEAVDTRSSPYSRDAFPVRRGPV